MSKKLQLDIENIAQTRADFLAVLDSGAELIVNFEECVALDLSGFQLLVSLVRERKENNKTVVFCGELKKEHAQLMILFGVNERDCLTGEELEKNLKAVL